MKNRVQIKNRNQVKNRVQVKNRITEIIEVPCEEVRLSEEESPHEVKSKKKRMKSRVKNDVLSE